MKGNPLTGAGYLLRGFSLILKPGIRPFVIIPLVINVILFSMLIGLGISQLDRWVTWLLPAWLGWLEWLLWPFFAVTLSVITFYTFIHLGNLIGAPFNGLLSERVETHLKGNHLKTAFNLSQFLATLWPSLLSEFKKIGYFISRGGPLLFLFLIPAVNVAASFLWIIFSAWMLVLEYADYPMANHEILFSEQRVLIQSKRLMAFGFGCAGLLLLMIPVLNFLAMPTAVAGATAMWVEEFEGTELKQ